MIWVTKEMKKAKIDIGWLWLGTTENSYLQEKMM